MKPLLTLFFLFNVAFAQWTPDSTFSYLVQVHGLDTANATTLTRVSILESGWRYESHYARINNNIFGLNNGDMAFTSKRQCIDWMVAWMQGCFVKGFGDVITCMKFKNFNHNPGYYQYLNQILYYPKR